MLLIWRIKFMTVQCNSLYTNPCLSQGCQTHVLTENHLAGKGMFNIAWGHNSGAHFNTIFSCCKELISHGSQTKIF
jgi:hypothetical protein